MHPALARFSTFFEKNRKRIVNDYFTFLRFASVSSEVDHKNDILECLAWLQLIVEKLGFDTAVWETSRHPVLFATSPRPDPTKPTVLIYNHYDVQPVDPIELWQSAPFEPTIRDNNVFARGAQDNKGQCWYVITALQALLEQDKTLPVNIKLCIEGEEEIGSPGLAALLEQKRSELQADYLLVVDLGLHAPTVPAVTLGIRGMATMTVELQGSATDLHSGSHGGLAYNPNRALVEILAKLHDATGKVAVPGFYDDVVMPTDEERKKINFAFDEQEYERTFSAKPIGGEKNYLPLESAWLRPTLEINGVGGGYTGSGFKTVIPAKALAKISCRLVPNQDPHQIGRLVADFLKRNVPDGTELKVDLHPGVGAAVRTSSESRIIQAVAQAYSEVLNAPCEFILEGASIPIVVQLATISGSEIALMGYGLPGDKIHAPNEHFGLDRLKNGCLTIARTLELLGNPQSAS